MAANWSGLVFGEAASELEAFAAGRPLCCGGEGGGGHLPEAHRESVTEQDSTVPAARRKRIDLVKSPLPATNCVESPPENGGDPTQIDGAGPPLRPPEPQPPSPHCAVTTLRPLSPRPAPPRGRAGGGRRPSDRRRGRSAVAPRSRRSRSRGGSGCG